MIDNEVTDRHPLLKVAEWHDHFGGNCNSHLISYQRLTEDDLADESLRAYVEYHLRENSGELHGSPPDVNNDAR